MQIYDAPRVRSSTPISTGSRPGNSSISAGRRPSTGALALVEWPERVEEALPPDRLDIDLRFDPAQGPDLRKLTLLGMGAWAGASLWRAGSTSDAEARRLERRGREFMQGDASIRAYERLISPSGETAILMISPPRPDGPILRYGKPYAAIAKLFGRHSRLPRDRRGLARARLLGPAIFAHSVADGLALIEDFGDATSPTPTAPTPRATPRRSRCSPSCTGANCRRIAGRRRNLHASGLRHRGDAGRGRTGARLVRAGGRAGRAGLGRAHAIPRALARAPGADPRPARRPGRCATIIRRTCTGSPSARGWPASA